MPHLGHVVRAARLDKTKEKWKEQIDEMHELGGGVGQAECIRNMSLEWRRPAGDTGYLAITGNIMYVWNRNTYSKKAYYGIFTLKSVQFVDVTWFTYFQTDNNEI